MLRLGLLVVEENEYAILFGVLRLRAYNMHIVNRELRSQFF
jgi:hypothetical protein